jgi:hypothetical protein
MHRRSRPTVVRYRTSDRRCHLPISHNSSNFKRVEYQCLLVPARDSLHSRPATDGSGPPSGGGYSDTSSRYQRPLSGQGFTSRAPGIDVASDYGARQTVGDLSSSAQQGMDIIGRSVVDQSNRQIVDRSGNQLAEVSTGLRQFNESSGRSFIDQNGRQTVEQNVLTITDPGINGRQQLIPTGDPNNRPTIDPVTQLPIDLADHSTRSRQSASAIDSNGRPADSAGRPFVGPELSGARQADELGARDLSSRLTLDQGRMMMPCSDSGITVRSATVDHAPNRIVSGIDGKLSTDPSLMQDWRPDSNEMISRMSMDRERSADEVTQLRPGRENDTLSRRPSGRMPQDQIIAWQSHDADPNVTDAVRTQRSGRTSADQQWNVLEER